MSFHSQLKHFYTNTYTYGRIEGLIQEMSADLIVKGAREPGSRALRILERKSRYYF